MKKTLLTLVLAAGTAQANGPLTLDDLLAGKSITAGDKLFDEWELIFSDSSDPNFTFNLANIDVTALNDGSLDPGSRPPARCPQRRARRHRKWHLRL